MRRFIPLVAVLLVSSFAHAQVREVIVGVSPHTDARAYLSSEDGLRVAPWPGAPGGELRVANGALPRFDGYGNLYFERATDDGHVILSQSTWVVRAGDATPRSVRRDDVVPPYTLPPPAAAVAPIKVCVDPGHGGSDPGASGFGLLEKDVTLDVVLKLIAWLDLDTQDTSGGGEWDVLATRTADVTVSLTQRTNLANAFGAASFLSIHMNAFASSSANGTETYCYLGQENNAGGRLRNVAQTEALNAWALSNRGVKTANFAVLRQTVMPAALVEGGFITSPIDVVRLQDPVQRDRLALHMLFALQQHHGFGRYQPSSTTTGLLKGVVYDATLGTAARIGGALVGLPDGSFAISRSTDGYFEFSLPPGALSYGATMPGFDAASTSRTVVGGGEVWGSLGLRPANVPALTVNSAPRAGTSLGFSVQGDPGSPVALLFAATPGFPLLDLSAFGFGIVWPDLATSIGVPLGAIPPGGTLSLGLVAPSTVGARAHMQALVLSGGQTRLSNGAAFEVR